ncbi:MAG: GAF domain-containing protein, partial [Gaiellaceae bacterium]
MRIELQHATTRVLAASPSLTDAGPRLLHAIGEAIGWELGELWLVDAAAGVLRWSAAWNRATIDAADFIALSQPITFTPGSGLPGHVWATGAPGWIPDVEAAACFRRFAAAARLGLQGAFAFPIRTDTTIMGVSVFFGRQRRRPEPDWLDTLDSLGRQIGDFIERRRAEGELRELQKLTQQRERLADIGAITAQIVHDLGNPLSGVSMQAQLILRRARRDANQPISTVVKAVESILAEVRRLDSLTKEFMEFSREQRLDVRAVDLRGFLQRVVDLWQPVAAARAIALDFAWPVTMPLLAADEEKLHRVFDNLVKNAIEAIDRGPGRVGIDVTQVGPEALRISVTDTGPGIPDSVQV